MKQFFENLHRKSIPPARDDRQFGLAPGGPHDRADSGAVYQEAWGAACATSGGTACFFCSLLRENQF
jgi:hypothetical protein